MKQLYLLTRAYWGFKKKKILHEFSECIVPETAPSGRGTDRQRVPFARHTCAEIGTDREEKQRRLEPGKQGFQARNPEFRTFHSRSTARTQSRAAAARRRVRWTRSTIEWPAAKCTGKSRAVRGRLRVSSRICRAPHRGPPLGEFVQTPWLYKL